MRQLKKTIAVLLAAWILSASLCASLAVSPSDYDMSAPQNLLPEHLYAESALLVDEDSGEVLFSKNSRIRMFPASTTKIMTLLLGLESGIGPDEKVTIPKEAADIASGSSVIPVKPGDVTTFRDLLYGFMLSSGNDGANAIAVLVDGSLDAFVDHMNARAQEIGCEGTHYVNAHGYHDSNHYTTAQDLALIARVAMQNEAFRTIVAAPTWDMTVTRGSRTGTATIVNRNSLLLSNSKYYYPDCTGIKTGHHRKAGWCFVGSAQRAGRRVICVVLNCEEEVQKWYDAARLFEYGFTRYESVGVQSLIDRAKPCFDTVTVENAADDDPQGGLLQLNVELTEGGEQAIPLPSGSETAISLAAEKVAGSLEIEWDRNPAAPVAIGEKLGTLRGTLPGGGAFAAALTASRSVDRQPDATPVPTQAPSPAPTEIPAADADPSPGSGLVILAGMIAALVVVGALLGALIARQHRHARRRRRKIRRKK